MSLRRPLSLFATLLALGGCGVESYEEGVVLRQSEAATTDDGGTHHTGLDLAVTDVSVACAGPLEATVSLTVKNEAPTGIDASEAGIYAGDPEQGGTLLKTVAVPWLVGGESRSFQETVVVPAGAQRVYVKADRANFYPEDNESNNTKSAALGGSCGLPNVPPVALCKNVTVQACGVVPVSVDNGSYDLDHGPGSLSFTQSPAGPYPVGVTPVTLTVSDGQSSSSCAATVTVQGGTGPMVPGASRDRVLPRSLNADYVDVTIADCAWPAQDSCGAPVDPQQVGRIVRIESDETDNALFSLNLFACKDIVLAADRKSAHLRAESSLLGNGRVYTMTYTVQNASGTASTGTCKVRVPSLQGLLSVGLAPNYCQGDNCPAGTGTSLICALLGT